MGKHLVVVGGGHAHLTCLKNLRDFSAQGHEVTVIGPATHHYYSGMGPGMLGGTYRPQEIRFNSQRMAEAGGARYVKGLVTLIKPAERRLLLASGKRSPTMWSPLTSAAASPRKRWPLKVTPMSSP